MGKHLLVGPLKLRDVILDFPDYEVDREETIIYVPRNTAEVKGDTDAFLMVLERPGFRPEGLVYFLELSVIRSVMDALEQNGLHCNERGKVKAVIHYADRDCFIEASDLTEDDLLPRVASL